MNNWTKTNNSTLYSRFFALSKSPVSARNCNWFITLFAEFVIGGSNYLAIVLVFWPLFEFRLTERFNTVYLKTSHFVFKGGAHWKTCKSMLWFLSSSQLLGCLSNHDDEGNKNPTNLHIWQWKIVFLHALHVQFSSFDILKTFLFFLRLEKTCFVVVWTTWAYDDKCSILSSYVPSPGSNLIPG